MSGRLRFGPRGNYGQPLEENAGTQTDISEAHGGRLVREVRGGVRGGLKDGDLDPDSTGDSYTFFLYVLALVTEHGAFDDKGPAVGCLGRAGRPSRLGVTAVGSTVTKSDWESARFEILAGFAAIVRSLEAVPETVREATRELVRLGLLEEAAGSGPAPEFQDAAEWPLPAGR
ncbi:hypothetical protein CYMTET_46780 [Cymbomonas tetramitiformis]|uniref:Uncharacterized protein n=1 Tax=Cymbomonas tetramitiformis TaxID=36881 RepID=A0AAE0BVH1_9CHLO|nr:hypothetical protein CYMTET_46780 [Cymbomonas tetramitiformis]